ncbi:MAG: FAD binding domain-containing protein [Planctomycetota bacterium]
MISFEYAQPDQLLDVMTLLAPEEERTMLMGGGTQMLALLKENLIQPRRIVSLASVPELREIKYEGTSLRIGATATLTDLLESERVRELYPSVIDAVEAVASPQIRNLGTVGGQVMRRPDCWYYHRGYGLFGTKTGQSLPLKGDHRDHAILGNSGPARFVSSSRLGPVLYSLEAAFVVATAYSNVAEKQPANVRSPRQAKAYIRFSGSKLWKLPQSVAETELAPTSVTLLSHVLLPPRPPTCAYYEVRSRRGFDQPEASAAVVLDMRDQEVRRCRVVLGHVAPIPWLVDVSAAILGKPVNEATAEAVGRLAVAGATPLERNKHKVVHAMVATKRALLMAIARAR